MYHSKVYFFGSIYTVCQMQYIYAYNNNNNIKIGNQSLSQTFTCVYNRRACESPVPKCALCSRENENERFRERENESRSVCRSTHR